MSILKMEMFTVICDNCGKSADEGTDYVCWNDRNQAKEVAMESGYICDGQNHYCQDCIYYDDDDNLIIKKNLSGVFCITCKNELIIQNKTHYFRGRYFSGLVCKKCNALYDDPKESFTEYVMNYKNKYGEIK